MEAEYEHFIQEAERVHEEAYGEWRAERLAEGAAEDEVTMDVYDDELAGKAEQAAEEAWDRRGYAPPPRWAW